MTLRAIVQAVGGELYEGGRRALIPAPGHSAADRSVSLLLSEGRVVAHSFGREDWREALDHLRALGLIDAGNRLRGAGVGAAPAQASSAPTRDLRRRAAARIWGEGAALAGTLGERHCRLRSIGRPLPGQEALRFSSAAPMAAYRQSGPRRPALLAAVIDRSGALAAVEMTYLDQDGRRAGRLRLSRKTVGVVPCGSAVRLDAPASELLVAEGVFTALSASERFALPAWALLSAGNLARWSPPEGVRSVLLAADRGAAGEGAAATLQSRLAAGGVSVRLALPPAGFGDWNEAAGAYPGLETRTEPFAIWQN